MELKNKVVWITGASSGIGEGLSYALAKEGCKLVISARRVDELVRVKQQTQLTEEDVLILPIDLEKNNEAHEWVQKVIQKFGRIDILLNNGGLSQKVMPWKPQLMLNEKLWKSIILVMLP